MYEYALVLFTHACTIRRYRGKIGTCKGFTMGYAYSNIGARYRYRVPVLIAAAAAAAVLVVNAYRIMHLSK